MQGFLISFLNDPNQDLDKFLGDIQAYYNSLPAADLATSRGSSMT